MDSVWGTVAVNPGGEVRGMPSQSARVHILSLPLTGCVTLGRWFNMCGPQFLHVTWG